MSELECERVSQMESEKERERKRERERGSKFVCIVVLL